MDFYQQIREENIKKYGTEVKKILGIIINQYSDRTHFIYEIIQNAEDAGAQYINFRLDRDKLTIYHNGRPFNDRDVQGVCGIADGTKEDGTRIGHFGIGFKSVYCYTETPYIYSGNHNFVIEDQIFPNATKGISGLDKNETCMILPFNKAGVSEDVAYSEIKDALIKKITAESIIMLNNIGRLTIDIADIQDVIEISKEKGSIDKFTPDNVFELSLLSERINRKTGEHRDDGEKSYLYFTDADKEAVSIIFRIEGKELQKIENSKIYAFFPTAKESHQNFYLHAPFDTTPARDNFKEGAEYGKHNVRLLSKINDLIEFAFCWMRDHGYLSFSGFNKVYPIYQYSEEDILYSIYQNSVRIIKNNESLLPTNKPGVYKSISEVCEPLWSVIVEAFPDEDMQHLLHNRNMFWISKEISTEAYSDLKRFIHNNFDIKTIDWKNLVCAIDADFLKQKKLPWFEFLFSHIENYCVRRIGGDNSHYIDASKIPFVRLVDGSHILPKENGKPLVYLNNPKIAKYQINELFRKNDTIRSFYYRALQINEYNSEQEVIDGILPKYATKDVKFNTSNHIKENIEDLKEIKDASFLNESIYKMVADKYIVTDGKEWYRPQDLYIRSSDDRSGYFLAKGLIDIKYLSEHYFDDTVLNIDLDEQFFKRLGCNHGLRIIAVSKNDYKKAVKKYCGVEDASQIENKIFSKKYISEKLGWEKTFEGFPDALKGLTKEGSIRVARFLNSNIEQINIMGEIVGADDQHFSGSNVDSLMAYTMLGLCVCFEPWIFTKNSDKPCRPIDVDKDDLLDEYYTAKRLLSKIPFKESKSALMNWLEDNNIPKSDRELIKKYFSNPEELTKVAKAMASNEAREEQKKLKASGFEEQLKQADTMQVNPIEEKINGDKEGLTINPISEKAKENREKKIEKELEESLDHKISVTKGFSFTVRECNDQEREFLRNEYDGHCQICFEKIEKYDGNPYFEAINIIKENNLYPVLKNANYLGWNSLCLCPNCAAKYNYCSKKISSFYEQIKDLKIVPDSEDPIVINIELPLNHKEEIAYSPRHLISLQQAIKVFAEVGKE